MTITLREFVGREIIYCASSLIGDLSRLMSDASRETRQHIGVDEDELMDLMRREDWETPLDWHIDHDMDRVELIDALESFGVEPEGELDLNHEPWVGIPDDDLRATLLAHLSEEDDDRRTFMSENRIEVEYDEVYEHWIVTNWLAERLKEKGEITGEVCGLTIWGRCTTGQSISMDGVIQRIYTELTGAEVTSADY